ncbi:MAG TPA: sialidase family protein, partial [Nocardioidaceae bacterium]|nr:sialidase family protein [Nocardioidaceae bacterium]
LVASLGITGVATVGDGASASPGSPYVIGPDILVSGPSTLTACPFGATPDFAAGYDDAEVEPQVAVNPTDPDEILGVSQQDRWPDGGARGLSSWLSSDGGASWAKTPDVPWSGCQGGPVRFGRVTDPWASYDAGGNLYFIGQPIDSAALGISAISVATWDGSSWSDPTILIEDEGSRGVSNDKVSITGDPTRAGYAYATWLRFSVPNDARQNPTADLHSFAYRGYPMLSRTTDGGETWSAPEPMRKSNSYFQGNQIAVGPDGTLYSVAANLFTGAGFNANGVYMSVSRSTDAGRTWSSPVKVGPIRTTQLFVPDDGFPIRAGDYIPDIAVDMQTGAIYVVWADGLGTPLNKIVMAKSTDRGRHWIGPVAVSAGGPTSQAYNHAVDVTDNGTVVLTYFDDRNNDPSDGIATTDIWLRHSHDGAATWQPEQHLHGPFDHYTAPISYFAPRDPRGLFLGDYMGLETISGDDVIAFFTSTLSDGADVHAVRLEHP